MDISGIVEETVTARATVRNSGDYVGADGLLVCGKCGKKKQHRIEVMGHEMTVTCLCQCEQDARTREKRQQEEQEKERHIRNLRTASLISGKYADASFSRYCIRPENRRIFTLAKNYVERFDEMRSTNQGLLFYGPVGTGKSYTAACIANQLLSQGQSVIMTSFVKILQNFRDEEAEDRFMEQLDQASLVILDDLGAERGTGYAQEKVYNIVDSRVRANLPMILTTNLTAKELNDTRRADNIQCRRIYDRILEVCFPVEFTGNSFREMRSVSRNRKMRELME